MEDSNDLNDELEKSRSRIGERFGNHGELGKRTTKRKACKSKFAKWMWSERHKNRILEPVRKSYVKIDEQTTPEIVPKQIEKVQRGQMALSNDEEEQVSDQMPDQQAVGQF